MGWGNAGYLTTQYCGSDIMREWMFEEGIRRSGSSLICRDRLIAVTAKLASTECSPVAIPGSVGDSLLRLICVCIGQDYSLLVNLLVICFKCKDRTAMAQESTMEWKTRNGNSVIVEAENGELFVSLEGDDFEIDHSRAVFDRVQQKTVLFAGVHSTPTGKQFKACILTRGHEDELKQLRENSKPTEPLTYEVVEHTNYIPDGWGGRMEKTELRLRANKTRTEMTDKEGELNIRINKTRDVPDDAEPGDEYTLDDLLEDTRTRDERDQDALNEAAEKGETVTIKSWTEMCPHDHRECNVDHMTRIATPGGEIRTERVHTY